MADYDKAEVTDRERKAASNLNAITGYNVESTLNQLKQQMSNYDQADQQNRSLADVQRNQNSRKAAGERFGANKKLQSAVQNLGADALNGSQLYGLLDMLATRTDLDNNDVWRTLTENQNAVENAYQESMNQNALSRNDLASNAEYALRGYNADLAAQLNNINPTLYAKPGTGDANIKGTEGVYDQNSVDALIAQLAGYINPANAQQRARQTQAANNATGNSFYDRYLNTYNAGRQ